ncbi:NIPSNAP family protein [Lysobacter panacisoli]|uniref:NIPSNAP domain-containing protein n=1 Tax=Lysobacter panacisoli TaxID=1255263 RepID=A0ABP9LQY9_9GAMM|nr:NIPSNAP family protein [Lysobacter panacisoli]
MSRTSPLLCLLASASLFACAWMPGAAQATQSAPAAGAPIQQLRIYEIFDDTRGAFHARFRDHAMRIMRRHGFDIVATWESRHDGRIEFVYLLQWPDEATLRERWAGFMADEEWARIKRETRAQGPMVGEIEDRTLVPTDYSPVRGFPVPPSL